MKTSERLDVIVHILNFVIFLYFSIKLLQSGFLDVTELLISAIGLFASVSVSILGAIERIRGR